MRGLYAIIDVVTLQRRGLDIIAFADAVLSAEPAAVQLRDKRLDARATLSLLRELGPLARRRRVPLFANDRADLAALAGCDGLHVGQTDLPPALARRVAGALGGRPQIGLSIHNLQQLSAAQQEPLDYLAFGPVFETGSKANPDPTLGLAGLAELAVAAKERALPCVAIGGISLSNAAEVAQLCPSAAVIGALLPAASEEQPMEQVVSERARKLHELLSGTTMAQAPRTGAAS